MGGFTREDKLTFEALPRSSELYPMWKANFVQDVVYSSKRDNPTEITMWIEESFRMTATEDSLAKTSPFEAMDSNIRMRISGEAMALLQNAREGLEVSSSLATLLSKLEPLCYRINTEGNTSVTGRFLAHTVMRICVASAGVDARRKKVKLAELRCHSEAQMATTMLIWNANANSLSGTENQEKLEMLMNTFGAIESVRMAETALRIQLAEGAELQYSKLLAKIQTLIESRTSFAPPAQHKPGRSTTMQRVNVVTEPEIIQIPGATDASSEGMERLRQKYDELEKDLEQIKVMRAEDEVKGKGWGKGPWKRDYWGKKGDKNGKGNKGDGKGDQDYAARVPNPRQYREAPPEYKERYSKIPKLDKDYCMHFQQPPLGPCVFEEGKWIGRQQLGDGTWVCLKPGCRRIHEEVPTDQQPAAMDLRSYIDDLNGHWQEVNRKERENAGGRP